MNYDGNILIQDVVKGRTKVDASVLRRDEIREDSPQYANIAVAYANPISRAEGSPFGSLNVPVTFQELNTSGYLSTSVVQAETNTEVRIQTAGTYLVEVGCSVSTRPSIQSHTHTVIIKLQEANGTGSFAEIARVEGLAPATTFTNNATLSYKRIVTITELRKYKILVDSQSTGLASAGDFQGAFISIQRLSN